MTFIAKRDISEFLFLKIIVLFQILFIVSGCKKEIILAPPKINITAIEIKNLASFEIKVDIDLGEQQEIRNAKLIFEDITVLTAPGFEKVIELTGERIQSQTISFQNIKLNHDYNVTAILKTDKYEYFSEKQVVRLPKNYFVFMISGEFQYSLLDYNIGSFNNPGGHFGIMTRFLNIFPYDSIEVKLNGTIPCSHNITLKLADNVQDYLVTTGLVTIPENTPPGDYEVTVFIDGIKFNTDKKIRVLEGKWVELGNQYPGEMRVSYSNFIAGGNLYIVGGVFPNAAPIRSPVWEYSFLEKKWSSKKDFPHDANMGEFLIYPFQLQFEGNGYVVAKNRENIELWKYESLTDNWLKVTIHPGLGKILKTGFIINNQLFLGGLKSDGETSAELWSFDFISGLWQKMNDFTSDNRVESFCTHKGKAYLFINPNKIIEYNPETNQWSDKSKFIGPYRYGASLVSFEDNLYLIGGLRVQSGGDYIGLTDFWSYSPITGKWDLKAFLPCSSSQGISFVFNSSIICGLGYGNSFSSFTDHALYQFIP